MSHIHIHAPQFFIHMQSNSKQKYRFIRLCFSFKNTKKRCTQTQIDELSAGLNFVEGVIVM
jgi:hypothetical protein